LLNHQNEKKIVLLFRSTYNKQFWVKEEKKAQKRENNKNDNKQPNDVKMRRKKCNKNGHGKKK
jgi:hypothetical protein